MLLHSPVFLTLCSAALYALSFPPFSFWPLAWIALIPFFIVLTRMPPKLAAAYGMLWGIAMTGGVAWCLPTMLMSYFDVSRGVAWLGLLVAGVGFAGIYYAGFAYWLSWITRRINISPLLLSTGWGVCEFARANPFIGTPWALLGYSQVALSPLMQIADLTGPYGVGMVLAAVNASLASLIAPALRSRRPLVSSATVLVLVGGVMGYGIWRLSQTFTTQPSLSIAVVQGAIARPWRLNPAYREINLARYLTLTREAGVWRPQAIFWPEYAVDFYLQEAVPEQARLLQMSLEMNAALILGGPHYSYGVKDRVYHNSVFLVQGGQLAGRYDKIRLLPFAEGQHFGGLFSSAAAIYEPGRQVHGLRVDGARIGAFLCLEAMFPDLVRRFAVQGAEVLVNPSNDDWFGFAAPARHQLDIALVRAIENRRYLVRPTTTGYSAVVDPHGRIIALSRFGASDILVAAIAPSRVQTPYQRWGDAVAWLAVALVGGVTLFCLVMVKRKN